MRKIPVIIPYFTEEEALAAKEVLESGWVAQGPKVAEFEQVIAKHENVAFGVATTSCTTALHLVMTVSGITSGMDVLVPAFTFVATANSVVETGAVPVLIDIEQETYNIDTNKIQEKIETSYEDRDGRLYNKKTGNLLWGIVPVHQFGLCSDIIRINEIAKKYQLNVIEDAACALGAQIGEKHIGSFGNPACISFHPRKSITTGEGGMVLMDNEILTKKMKELRSHGSSISADARDAGKGYLLPEFTSAGYNYRMTDIQGAIGLAQAKKLDFILDERRKRAEIYNDMIKQEIPELIAPFVPEGYFHTYQSYVCMLNCKKLGVNEISAAGEFRNLLLDSLEKIGIATRQGTHAVHLLSYYKKMYGYKPEDLPNAYACDHLSMTLPLYVQMTDEDQRYVIFKIKEILKNGLGE